MVGIPSDFTNIQAQLFGGEQDLPDPWQGLNGGPAVPRLTNDQRALGVGGRIGAPARSVAQPRVNQEKTREYAGTPVDGPQDVERHLMPDFADDAEIAHYKEVIDRENNGLFSTNYARVATASSLRANRRAELEHEYVQQHPEYFQTKAEEKDINLAPGHILIRGGHTYENPTVEKPEKPSYFESTGPGDVPQFTDKATGKTTFAHKQNPAEGDLDPGTQGPVAGAEGVASARNFLHTAQSGDDLPDVPATVSKTPKTNALHNVSPGQQVLGTGEDGKPKVVYTAPERKLKPTEKLVQSDDGTYHIITKTGDDITDSETGVKTKTKPLSPFEKMVADRKAGKAKPKLKWDDAQQKAVPVPEK